MILLYSCITGDYDTIKRQPVFPGVDYRLFGDQDLPEISDNVLKARFVKMHIMDLIPGYDYYLWIDGDMQIYNLPPMETGELGLAMHLHPWRQCVYQELQETFRLRRWNYSKIPTVWDKYRREGMPQFYGLWETGMLLIKNGSKTKEFMKQWYEETINTGSCQIALPYVLWKSGYKKEDVTVLGDNIRNSGYVRLYPHNRY